MMWSGMHGSTPADAVGVLTDAESAQSLQQRERSLPHESHAFIWRPAGEWKAQDVATGGAADLAD
jgi:hypothetical protein